MQAITGQAQAGVLTPMVSGTPRQWAVTTSAQIIEASTEASVDTITRVELLRYRIGAILAPYFAAMRSKPSPDQVMARAEEATSSIVDFARGTPWSLNFSEPTMRQAIRDNIARNLTSAGVDQ